MANARFPLSASIPIYITWFSRRVPRGLQAGALTLLLMSPHPGRPRPAPPPSLPSSPPLAHPLSSRVLCESLTQTRSLTAPVSQSGLPSKTPDGPGLTPEYRLAPWRGQPQPSLMGAQDTCSCRLPPTWTLHILKRPQPCPPSCLPAQHPQASLNPGLPTTGPASSSPPRGKVLSPSPGCRRGPGADSDLLPPTSTFSDLNLAGAAAEHQGHTAAHPSQPPLQE